MTLRECFREFEGFNVFGPPDILDPKKFHNAKKLWKPCFIYAIEPSAVILVNYEKLMEYMIHTSEMMETNAKLETLEAAIPGFHNLFAS